MLMAFAFQAQTFIKGQSNAIFIQKDINAIQLEVLGSSFHNQALKMKLAKHCLILP